jgi:hypothetical protein
MPPSIAVRWGMPACSAAARAMKLVVVGVALALPSPSSAFTQGPRAGYIRPSNSVESVGPASANVLAVSNERSIGTSVRNGAAIGALVGLLTGALVYSVCRGTEPGGENCTGKAALAFGITTAAGAAIGYLVGASDPDPKPGN